MISNRNTESFVDSINDENDSFLGFGRSSSSLAPYVVYPTIFFVLWHQLTCLRMAISSKQTAHTNSLPTSFYWWIFCFKNLRLVSVIPGSEFKSEFAYHFRRVTGCGKLPSKMLRTNANSRTCLEYFFIQGWLLTRQSIISFFIS